MSQPPKSTIFAPAARWVAFKIVCLVIGSAAWRKREIIAARGSGSKLINCAHGETRIRNRPGGGGCKAGQRGRAALQRRLDAGAFRRAGSATGRTEIAPAGNPGRRLQRGRAH